MLNLPVQSPATTGRAVRTALAHLGVQRGALVSEPLLPLDVRIVTPGLAALLFSCTELAEFLVRFDLRLQFANYEFDVYGVIEESQSRDMIRNDVLGIAEIDERTDYADAILVR